MLKLQKNGRTKRGNIHCAPACFCMLHRKKRARLKLQKDGRIKERKSPLCVSLLLHAAQIETGTVKVADRRTDKQTGAQMKVRVAQSAYIYASYTQKKRNWQDQSY